MENPMKKMRGRGKKKKKQYAATRIGGARGGGNQDGDDKAVGIELAGVEMTQNPAASAKHPSMDATNAEARGSQGMGERKPSHHRHETADGKVFYESVDEPGKTCWTLPPGATAEDSKQLRRKKKKKKKSLQVESVAEAQKRQ